MSRQARKQSESGIYHVMLRGINRQVIFEDEQDMDRFLELLVHYRKEGLFSLFAYCLMSNHVHLLIREKKETLDSIMKRIGVSYVMYYNVKYARAGHLFQDRYKSQPVEDDEYLIQLMRYIHQNPVKAGLCRKTEDYKYSSYAYYAVDAQKTGTLNKELIDTETVFGIIGRDELAAYMEEENDDKFMDIDDGIRRISDAEATEMIRSKTGLQSPTQLQKADRAMRDRIIAELNEEGVTMRQIERITGLSHGVVQRACER